MSGHFSGVQSRLREKAPQAVYAHCHSYRLNLVIGDYMQKNTKNFINIFSFANSLELRLQQQY